jgi:hypothetical protein
MNAQDALDHAMGARAATRLTLQMAIRALNLWTGYLAQAREAGDATEVAELAEALGDMQEVCALARANVNAANAAVRAAVDQIRSAQGGGMELPALLN